MKQIMRPGTQLYPQFSQVVAVNDPEKKGRVKVLYGDKAPIESDWIYTLGISSGTVPTQFIGTRGITIFIDGNQEEAIFMGTIHAEGSYNTNGSPLSIPIIDIRANTQVPACTEENRGMTLVFSDTESEDLKICTRNNVISSKDDEDIPGKYFWKSLSHSLVVSKGNYGRSNFPDEDPSGDTRTSTIWGPCLEQLQGETRLFSEDRSLSQTEFMCRKQPGDKLYAWVPKSSPPIYTKENLPKCDVNVLGATVAIDDGKNTELLMCGRKDSTEGQDNLVWIKFVRSFLASHNGPTQKGLDITKNKDEPKLSEDLYIQQTPTFIDDVTLKKNALAQIFNGINAVVDAVDKPSVSSVINAISSIGLFNK